MKRITKYVLLFTFLATSFSCAQRKITRVSPSTQTDLSGRWNDTDSKLVATEMISDILGQAWLENFRSANGGKKPVLIVGLITNKSSEHIESETFVKDIERELINSGRARIVQNDAFREKLRQERAQQGEFASKETQAKWGLELGADYMLFGVINSTVDSYKKEKVVNYKVNLELADLETTEKVWIGDKEIKKYIKN